MQSVYDAAGGEPAMLALARAWHERCLADEVVAHAFTHYPLYPAHTERLAAYWGEQLGGPPAYTSGLGTETGVRRMHAGNGEHRDMDARALGCFAGALADTGLDTDPRLREALTAWFAWALEQMAAYPGSPADVPGDLVLPVWGWDGPRS